MAQGASISKMATAASLALDSIRAHKLRSFLTLLGMIMGVASVILVGAAIDGLGAYTENITSRAFGSDSFLFAQIASVGRLSARELADKQRINKRIRPEDVTYLRQETGDAVIYSPYQNRVDDVKAENQLYQNASILGVSSTLPQIRDVPVSEGRFFNETEETRHSHVAVIGDDIRNALFPGQSVIGKIIRVGGQEFTVIGLLERQGSSFGQSLDNPVYIPTSVYSEIYGSQRGMAVFGRAIPGSHESMDDALNVTRSALRSRFHARVGKPDNFDFLTPDSVRSFVGQILGVIAAVVVPITGISLVVGGIVVMNIMLVSVTERTREIGVRKVLVPGAVTSCFNSSLSRSFSLSSEAVSVSRSARWSPSSISKLAGLTLVVTLPYVIVSVFVSSAVGIISGWYPARRAAYLDPVVALRAE